MAHIFCPNKQCGAHFEVGDEYAEDVIHGVPYGGPTAPKHCKECGYRLLWCCPNLNCQSLLHYWPPQFCEGCGLDFDSITFDASDRLKKEPLQLPE
jgi:hypothetical protein